MIRRLLLIWNRNPDNQSTLNVRCTTVQTLIIKILEFRDQSFCRKVIADYVKLLKGKKTTSKYFEVICFELDWFFSFNFISEVELSSFLLSHPLDLAQASDRFYEEVSIGSIRLNRFGLEVGEDSDFDSANTEIVLESPENAEFLQVT